MRPRYKLRLPVSFPRYNRLYTVTGQCLEEDVPAYLELIQGTVRSLKAELQAVA